MADLSGIAEDVHFDWSGAERLAAELRAAATACEGQIPRRTAIAGRAAQEWRGAYAEQFAGRMRTCTGDAARLADAMRQAASQVDELSRLAREEQDRRERAREWQREQDAEGVVEKVGEWIFGDDDQPPIPPPVRPPTFTSPAPVSANRG